MRSLLIAAAALALPASSSAQPPADAPLAESLPSPQTIDGATDSLHRMIDGLMQVDIAPLADAIDPHRHHSDGPETLGNLGRRDDPNFDERVHRSVDVMADQMADVSYKMRKLEPVLRRSLEDVARNVEDAMNAPYGDDYRRDRHYRDD